MGCRHGGQAVQSCPAQHQAESVLGFDLQQHRDSAGRRRVHSAVRLEAESDVRRGGDELKLRQRRFQRAAAEIVFQSAPGRTPGVFLGACRAGCRPAY